MTIREKLWGLVVGAMHNDIGVVASLGAQIDNLMEGMICIEASKLTNGTLYCILKDYGVDVEKYGDDWDSLFENELEKLK